MTEDHERIDFDVLFVGGGPANLAGAIHLIKTAKAKGIELEVALIEKGAEIGSHAISGAILNPMALAELIPDYLEKGCPIENTVRGDEFYYFTATSQFRLPVTPRPLHNKGYYVISLSRFTRWLGETCEELGINIFPGFAGQKVLFDTDEKTIIGVRTGQKGLNKDGKPKSNYEPSIDLMAKVTVFGEGARGSLIKSVEEKLGLYSGKMPPVYETGIKEVIQLPEHNYFSTSKGNDIHVLGYPLGLKTPGGGFIYEMADNKVAIGYLAALCYKDPMLDPYDVFIRFKQHPFVANIIKNGKVIEQGARTASVGGYYSMPKQVVSGGLFVGAGASIHNTPAIKGIHLSMKSGMLAADAVLVAHDKKDFSEKGLSIYSHLLEKSWVYPELYEGRNTTQALSKKGLFKLIHLGAQYFSNGRGLRDPMRLEEDFKALNPMTMNLNKNKKKYKSVSKDTYDGELYVDKLTGIYLSKTSHREDQPSHLIVHNSQLCITKCFDMYKSPCTRFCPGNVYEIEEKESGKRRLKLNPSNCLHCKTCDIKDPFENITWTCPEGGEGPNYSMV
jgi:electron-transferring-flavoprotein dehydrogenase